MTTFSNDLTNLIDYINDVKPYHSKLTQVNEELLFGDRAKVSVLENIQLTITDLDGSTVKIEI